MRHVPTSVYIDTEVFKRNQLRFDNTVFVEFKKIFTKGGLRLLVPSVMERELLRHFKRDAEKHTDNLLKAYKAYPIQNILLAELPSSEDLKSKCMDEMVQQWTSFKEHFICESLPTVGNLDDVLDWYFDVRPPFSEAKNKEFPDAFIINVLDHYHKDHQANIAVIGFDGDFINACATRRYIQHFPGLTEYIDAFRPELSGEERLPGDVDFTKPITTEDLRELKMILCRGDQVTQIEIQRVISLLDSRGTNYEYFFKNADDAVWFSHLLEAGYFLNPPNAEQTTEGKIIAPWWPPLGYLIAVFDKIPKDVLDLVSTLPDTDNFRILEMIVKIILKADSAETVFEFSRFVFSFIEKSQWSHELIITFLSKPYIFDPKLSEITPPILLKLVEFRSDSNELEKQNRRKENSLAWGASFKPAPRFSQWAYQEILIKGVRPLAERAPYQVARVLIDAAAGMIRLQKHPEDLEKERSDDSSEISCPRLDQPDHDNQDAEQVLLLTLTYACEQVYEKAPASVEALDQTLRNQRWNLFKRLRQHLYALHPNEQTLPWVREFILGYDDYSEDEIRYEFQLMVRKASEHFGDRLLHEYARTAIFDAIQNGPSKNRFREWMGERYTEEMFQSHQRHFRRKQLRPFATLLRGELRQYYDQLEEEDGKDPLIDQSYAPHEMSRAGFISNQSPKSTNDLAEFSDEELLTYINDWDNEHRDKDNWLIAISISALADVFQSVFKEKIVSDTDRLTFWMSQKDRISRPIYVTAMIIVIKELVKEADFEHLTRWIEFCGWVLSHPDTVPSEGQPKPRDDSKDHPDWHSSHRAVVDFIDACVDKDTQAPISAREGLYNLLDQVCNQFDERLENHRQVLANEDDPIIEAINNTRSRGMESLVNFGLWIRRYQPEDPVQEVFNILSKRIKEDAETPLTRPEYALLGLKFTNLCYLNLDWVAENSKFIFFQENTSLWRGVFGSYIRYNQPFEMVFEIIRKEYEFALAYLEILKDESDDSGELIDRLGQHIFSYYLWDVYSLTGAESLLAQFYTRTNDQRKYWAQLFSHVGRSLKKSGKHLDENLVERATAYFDLRVESAEPLELQEFTYWLDAECLDPVWRLQSYSKTLDLVTGEYRELYSEIRTLNKLLPDHLLLVIECFTKITEGLNHESQMYISVKEVSPILELGLASEDEQIRQNAERAKENLLRLSLFDFL